MAKHTPASLPDDDYLVLVGQMAYMVASVEGLVIHDLTRLAAFVPAKLTPGALASLTTAQIGESLARHAASVSDAKVRAYLGRGGALLQEHAKLRNALLHARPATIDGQQRLNRWTLAKNGKPGEFFPITNQWLEAQIDLISLGLRELSDLRPWLDAAK